MKIQCAVLLAVASLTRAVVREQPGLSHEPITLIVPFPRRVTDIMPIRQGL
jgi:hypothetical protein